MLRAKFYPLLKRAGLPRVRFHNLRHTAATLLLASGVDVKVVGEMLGHSTIAITLAIYYHVRPHKQREAADIMDRLLRRVADGGRLTTVEDSGRRSRGDEWKLVTLPGA